MGKLFRITMVLVMLSAGFGAVPASAQELPPNCTLGIQASGAEYVICMPDVVPWNGDAIVYAHGYVSPFEPTGIPWDHFYLPDGSSIMQIMNGMGFGFMASGYSKTGLAIKEGLADSLDLVEIFKESYPTVDQIYLGGASEGGIITTLGIEQNPQTFAGGMAACGPTGDFRKQLDYVGDTRTVFDYFFPGVLPPSPVDIPDDVITNWDTVYAPAIAGALAASPDKTLQYLAVTRMPVDPANPATIPQSVIGALWYNVFGTGDAVQTLGGQPYDNLKRIYLGSKNDFRLNRLIERFAADPAALAEINSFYQTSGDLSIPLVNLHTTGDPIVPYWHAALYSGKVVLSGSALQYMHIPVLRYGHCNFKPAEVLFAFALLVFRATGTVPLNIEYSLPEPAAQQEYLQLAQEYGVLDGLQAQAYLSLIHK